MYTVSSAFLTAVQKNTRSYSWSGTITTAKGTVYLFSNADIVKGSGYITHQCCGSSEIELGTVYAAELGLTLALAIDRYTLDGAQVELFYHLRLDDGTEETAPMGIFEVSEANRTINYLEIKAYDHMLWFEKSFGKAISTGTPYQYLTLASKACGVDLGMDQAYVEALPNGKEVFGVYTDNDIETWRDLLFYLAQSMACFATIDRAGKLLFKSYGTSPVLNIPNTQRFTSSFSDFKTRYTAVSSTNQRTKTAEYYALDPDDALTMNLGVSPLLQYGLEETRKRILETVLNAIAQIDYVPFDSTTIGNPALDVGDVLTFSGGHADAESRTCVTSFTYKINGKHSIRCVGKNPRLADAKSKNDKNITGLLNQVEAGKIIYYNFVNAAPFTIGISAQEILSIEYVAAESTSATFLAEILLESVPESGTQQLPATDASGNKLTINAPADNSVVLKVTYKNDLTEDTTFYPVGTYKNGKHILTLFYPISAVASNTTRRFSVLLSCESGSVHIGEGQIRATLSGQGLVSGLSGWDGRINISDFIGRLDTGLPFPYAVVAFDGTATVQPMPPQGAEATDTAARIRYDGQPFVVLALNENLTDTIIIKTFTLDTENPGQYDPALVEISSGAFVLKSDYIFTGQADSINYGLLERLALDNTQFDRIDSLEVSLC